MGESNNNGDSQGNYTRSSSLRPAGVLKSTLSGRLTPRASPSFRRLNSSRTPRRDDRFGSSASQLFRSNRVVYWLLLITLWTYGAFYVQSRWAHGNDQEKLMGFGNGDDSELLDSEQKSRRELISDEILLQVKNETNDSLVGSRRHKMHNTSVDFAMKGIVHSLQSLTTRKRTKTARRVSRGKTQRKQKIVDENRIQNVVVQEEKIPKSNATYGLLVGPFGSIEDRILEWSPEKRTGTCDRNDLFARLVWSRNFVLVLHELSMTGAPLSMLELATELLSCGATVQAVVLSKKGGLMSELVKRKIKVLDDKAEHSFKAAMKADLVIAGSAVCASWIEQYLVHFPPGSNQIAWWIMENRREYFDRSKLVLNRVKMLIFLSELQLKQWLSWCEEEKIKLNTQTSLIPLSVNDELAFVAGIACSLNTPALNPEKMLEKQKILRHAVRQEMGLSDNDMLVMALSSINAAKGQLLLLESAHLIIEEHTSQSDAGTKIVLGTDQDRSGLARKLRLRGLLDNQPRKQTSGGQILSYNSRSHKKDKQTVHTISIDRKETTESAASHPVREIKSVPEPRRQDLKILIGSVGSKSNKVLYIKEMLRFLSQHSNLSKSVLWTPATTRVASLYSAADVYVINSQGIGETFGRVTIEAMAFGLPVLGTDAGGTKEIVESNVTGLLHPVGKQGNKVLAENLRFLLENPAARREMGARGREKVEKMYLKRQMYKIFFEVLFKCMRIK
ncbi:hypothetical protein Droror1_Dr00013531 [Drosera rotundifolia]